MNKGTEYRVQSTEKRGIIFVVSGPSGSGKTTLLERLLESKDLPAKIAKSVSLTTRLARCGEKNGRDYFFISPKEFEGKLRAGKILEWTKYLGHYYGTPKDFAEKKIKDGKHVILCLDLKGVDQIRRLYPQNTVTIFIAPPSLAALGKRISGRCSKTKQEEILRRLKLAKEELIAAPKFDYRIVNKNITQAQEELGKIISGKIAGLEKRGR